MTVLSENFTLEEMIRNSRGMNNSPTSDEKANLKRLCKDVLQPFRDGYVKGRCFTTSGFRCKALNQVVGGSPTSAHLWGCAADIVLIDMPHNDTTYRNAIYWLKGSGLPIDQAIWETKRYPNGRISHWLHIGIAKDDEVPREQFLRSLPPAPGRGRTYIPIH